MTIGTLTAFYSLRPGHVRAPVRWMTFVNQMGQQAMAAGERVFEILDTPLDVAEKPDAVALPRLEGRLELERVSFAYGKGAPLLQEITATVEPGQTLALVGPSGSGKTTLINLIPRFYDVTAGAVRVDGHDVRDVALGVPAGPGGDGDAGDLPVQPHHPRQHLLRAGRGAPGGGRGGGAGGGGARLHRRVPGGLRDPDRGAGGAPLRAASASAWPSPGPSWSTPAS